MFSGKGPLKSLSSSSGEFLL